MSVDIAPELVEDDGTLRLTAILGSLVFDASGKRMGACHDVRAVRDGPNIGTFGAAYRTHEFLAGPGALGVRLGYDRGAVRGPWPIARLFTTLHSNAVMFGWSEIVAIEAGRIVLTSNADELRDLQARARPAGDEMFLGLALLDRQIVDSNGLNCGKVDDLDLVVRPDSSDPPHVGEILTGPGALAHRIGGRLGLWIESVHRRLHPSPGSGPSGISFGIVKRVGTVVELSSPRSDLENNLFERWARETFISRIPGSQSAAER